MSLTSNTGKTERDTSHNHSVSFNMSVSTYEIPSREEELLRKKQELEAELEKINSVLSTSSTFHDSSSNSLLISSISSKGHSRSRISPKVRRRSSYAQSIANQWDLFTPSEAPREDDCDVSSAANIKNDFIKSKKEIYLGNTKNVKIGCLMKCSDIKDQVYYIGCLHYYAQSHYLKALKTSGYRFSTTISGCTAVVYHENLLILSTNLRRRMMIASLGGLKFISTSQLDAELQVNDRSYQDEFSDSEFKKVSDTPIYINSYMNVSSFIRKCYCKGMALPFSGKFMCLYIDNACIAQDVEDAIVLLGGSATRIDQKDTIPAAVSHFVHDGRGYPSDKLLKCYHKLHYKKLFEDLDKEYSRLINETKKNAQK